MYRKKLWRTACVAVKLRRLSGSSAPHTEIPHIISVCVIPVDHMEPVVNVVGSQIVMFQVIGMLPDVDVEHGQQPKGERRVLICGRGDAEFPCCIYHKPCIAGTEYGQSGCLKLILKGSVAAKFLFNGFAQCSERLWGSRIGKV